MPTPLLRPILVALILCGVTPHPATAQAASVSGTVISPAGQPVPGALVTALAPGSPALPANPQPQITTTGPTGEFVLPDLPSAPQRMVAADGRLFGETMVRSGESARIELHAPPELDPAARDAFIASFNPSDYRDLLPYWDYLGEDQMEQLALRLDGAIGPNGVARDDRQGTALTVWLAELARRDPARAANLGPGLSDSDDPGAKWTDTRAAVAAACAMVPNPNGLVYANGWIESQKRSPARQIDYPDEATAWFRLAGIAVRLNRPDADGFLACAVAVAKREAKANEGYVAEAWGADLAVGGEAALLRINAPLTPMIRMEIWAGAVRVLAAEDLPSAQDALLRAEALDPDPNDKSPLGWKGEKDTGVVGAELRGARSDLLLAQARAGQPTVLQSPRDGIWEAQEPVFRALLGAALQRHDFPTARAALRAESTAPWLIVSKYWSDPRPYCVSLFDSYDPSLSPTTGSATPPNFRDLVTLGSPDEAYYRGFTDPAMSRIQLEIAWAKLRSMPTSNAYFLESGLPAEIAAALFPLDEGRALQWLSQVHGPGALPLPLEARIIALMCSDRSKWPVLPPM